MEASASLFHLERVCFSYRALGKAEVPVFSHLFIKVMEGEVLAVMAPSGAGKSTLIRILAGLQPPIVGEVRFRGTELYSLGESERAKHQRHMGMTFEKGGLFDSMTCEENLAFPLRERFSFQAKEIKDKVTHALEEVGLAGIEALYPHEISGGMKKRLGIARALILNPDVVLYDEPTAGLDPITARTIMELLLKMKQRYSMTSIVVTSDVGLAFQLADRVAFLHDGKIQQEGTVAQIRASENAAVAQFIHGTLEGAPNERRRR